MKTAVVGVGSNAFFVEFVSNSASGFSFGILFSCHFVFCQPSISLIFLLYAAADPANVSAQVFEQIFNAVGRKQRTFLGVC